MIWLPDSTVDHLVAVAGWPEFMSDRYEVLAEIGRGGMGTVYRAFDAALRRQVAMKVTHRAEPEVIDPNTPCGCGEHFIHHEDDPYGAHRAWLANEAEIDLPRPADEIDRDGHA